jgi:hypothetical protein
MNLAHKRHEAGRRDAFAVEWLCPPCHGRNDTPQRIAATRRRFARRAGQLWLLPEIEYAPFPLWEIPDEAIVEVLEALQEELPL